MNHAPPHDIKRKKEPTVDETRYIVLFSKGYTNLKNLSEKKVAANTIIRWEAYRNKNPNVTLCKNCLLLGHGTMNCHLKARFNKCGGAHKTEECTFEEKQAKRCANCSGAHDVMDRSCPKRADFIWSWLQSSKPEPPARKEVPAFNLDEFPPLSSAVPGEPSPQPEGSNGGTGAGGTKKDEADSKGIKDSKGISWEEVWRISLEYSARLKSRK